jgi:hypothetical protein
METSRRHTYSHDQRRYSPTHASRNGIPLEIVSKVILRHQDLKTTQAYLGRIREVEAIRWDGHSAWPIKGKIRN